MRNYLSSFWGRLASSALCELVELFGDKVSHPDVVPNPPNPNPGYYPRDRVFNQWRTFWMFLGQILSVNQTCGEALKKAQFWLWFKKKKRLI